MTKPCFTMRLLAFTLILSLSATMTACQTTGGPHKKVGAALAQIPKPFAKKDSPGQQQPAPSAAAQRPPQQIPIGSVHHVSTTGSFVLVKSRQAGSIEPGTSLITYSPSGQISGTLAATTATKRSFLSAELVTGNPGIGDRVVADLASGGQGGTSPRGGNQVQYLE